MKKLVIAAVAALALVSVSNVFASQKAVENIQNVAPTDTTDIPVPAPADTTIAK
ncbi:MAG: hypothetical protein Q4D41_03295 [Prevotellaceae bacterium]|nr:hypothetical protein [Prevotellaceae bacterium]